MQAAATNKLEIRAGRCEMSMQDNGKYMVTPVAGKGLISLKKGHDASFTSFSWEDNDTKSISDELVLMKDSLELVKVNTGRENDRVVRLKWKNSASGGSGMAPPVKMFWLQYKDTSKDESTIKEFNDKVKDPSSFNRSNAPLGGMASMLGRFNASAGASMNARRSDSPSFGAGETSESAADSAIEPTSGSLDFSALMGLAPSSDGNAAQDDLRAQLAAALGMPVPPGPAASAAPAAPPAAPAPAPVRLEDTVTAERVIATGILEDPAVRAALIPLLPAGQTQDGLLESNLRSPQLRQAMAQLTSALASDNYNSVMANLGVDPSAGADSLIRGDVVSVRPRLPTLHTNPRLSFALVTVALTPTHDSQYIPF